MTRRLVSAAPLYWIVAGILATLALVTRSHGLLVATVAVTLLAVAAHSAWSEWDDDNVNESLGVGALMAGFALLFGLVGGSVAALAMAWGAM